MKIDIVDLKQFTPLQIIYIQYLAKTADERKTLINELESRAKQILREGYKNITFGTFCPPLKDVILLAVNLNVYKTTTKKPDCIAEYIQ